MSGEVDFAGWVSSDENRARMKTDWKYRWSLHWNRFYKAIKYKNKNYWTWWNIKGLLFNQKKQF